MPSSTVYEFIPYRLLPAQRQLVRDATLVKLGSRAFDVLVALVERRDRTVSKNELMDLVWPTVVVEENNLEVQIVTLRKLLGHGAITTVPGRGYRFTLPVAAEGFAEPRQSIAIEARDTQSAAFAKSGYVPLPRPASMLVGRQADRDAVTSLLLNHRLVTLTGAGGIGKTRLAINVADKQKTIPNVAWVDLSQVADPELVPTAIAGALVVGISDAADTVASIVTAMRRRPAVLVVLDNAEHLIDVTADVVSTLISSVESLSLLITSREALRIDGEVTYNLGGLGVPNETVLASERHAFEAVSLFIDRAKAAGGRLILDDEATADIVAICRMLDGMPLAIELAAARAPGIGLKRLRSQLRDSLAVLASNRRDVAARQRTMNSTLEWSYEVLGGAEKAALRVLGVFAGGFTLDAFCAVVRDASAEDWKTVELLERLVEKSLVGVTSDDPPRYFLLETTRLFALDKLASSDDLEAARQKHARYFTSYFESIFADRFSATEEELTSRSWREIDNLRATLQYTLLQENDVVQGIVLLTAALPAWLEGRGQYSLEGRRYFDVAAQLAVGLALKSSLRARLCLGVGILYSHLDIERASEAFAEAIQIFRLCGDTKAEAHALIDQARLRARKKDLNGARAMLDRAGALLARLDNPQLNAWYEFCGGYIEYQMGDPQAMDHLRSAAAAFERQGNETRLLFALNEIGDAAWAAGDLKEAERQFRAVVARTESSQQSANDMLGIPLMNLAAVLIEGGNPVEGLGYAERALPLLVEAGRSAPSIPHVALGLARLGKYREAALLQGFALVAFQSGRFGEAEVNERRSLDEVGQLLGKVLEGADLVGLLADGEKLTEEWACDVALKTARELAGTPEVSRS